MKNRFKDILFLIGLIAFNFLGGLASSVLSKNMDSTLYDSLTKPWFSPPTYVFGIVWSILYVLLAVSAFLNYKKGGKGLVIYFISMIINFSWSIVFFGERLYGLGAIIIILIILFSIYLMIKYFKFSKVSSVIMGIYILWLSYAFYLNFFIWKYNEM